MFFFKPIYIPRALNTGPCIQQGDLYDSAEIIFQPFLHETLVSSSGMGRDVHSLMLSTASPTLQGALKDGFGQAVAACDMLES